MNEDSRTPERTAEQEQTLTVLTHLLVAAGSSSAGVSYTSRVVDCEGDDRLLEFTFLSRRHGADQRQRAWLRGDGRLELTEADGQALRVAIAEEEERIATTSAAYEAWRTSPEYEAAYETWRAKMGPAGADENGS